MESGVAIIPYLQAPDEERNEDVGILLTPLWLPLPGQVSIDPVLGLTDRGQRSRCWPKANLAAPWEAWFNRKGVQIHNAIVLVVLSVCVCARVTERQREAAYFIYYFLLVI